MKKHIAFLALCVGTLVALPGCGKKEEKKEKAKKVALEKTRVRKEVIETAELA